MSSLAAAILSVGAMTLQQVTTGAVANLVAQVAMGNIQVGIGKSAVGFGWSAVAFVCIAAIIIGAVVGAEMAADKARESAEGAVNRGLGKATGGKVDLEAFGTFGRTAEPMHPAYHMKGMEDRRGFAADAPGIVKPGISLASKLMQKRHHV